MFLQMTTLGYGLLLPIFVQIVLKQPATDAGVVLLPGAIVGAVFAPIGGLILDRLGAKKPIVLGLCCSFIATFCFLFFFKNLTYQSCILFYFIYSLGIGLIVGNTMTSAMSHLPKKSTDRWECYVTNIDATFRGNRNIHYSNYFSVCTTRNKLI